MMGFSGHRGIAVYRCEAHEKGPLYRSPPVGVENLLVNIDSRMLSELAEIVAQ